MWPPGIAVQGKGEGKGSLCAPSQEALALLRTLTQGTLPSTALGALPTKNTQDFCFQLPDPRLGGNQERTQVWGQKAFINHVFSHSFTRYVLLAHDTPVTVLGAVTWG